MLLAQSCLTLCDPMDCIPPGSSVHEIFQARILEWLAISFSRGYSQPRDQTLVSCKSPALQESSLLLSHWGSQIWPYRPRDQTSPPGASAAPSGRACVGPHVLKTQGFPDLAGRPWGRAAPLCHVRRGGVPSGVLSGLSRGGGCRPWRPRVCRKHLWEVPG